MPRQLTVTMEVDLERTAPEHLVLASGMKVPLYAAGDDDLRAIAGMLAEILVRRAAEQRAKDHPAPPPPPPPFEK